MKTKTQILSIVLSVVLSVGLVVTAVYATTTIGNDVSVGGTLGVTGATTLSSTLAVTGATTLAGALTANGNVIVNAGLAVTGNNITFGNDETIDNVIDGLVAVGGKVLVNGARVSTSTGYEYFLQVDGDITGLAAGAKTYGIYVSLDRPATSDTTGGDIDDAGIKVRVRNYADGNTAGNVLRAIDAEAASGDSGATITNLQGATITAYNRTGAGDVTDMTGLKVENKVNAAVTGNSIGLDIRMYRQAATAPTAEYALKIRNDGTIDQNIDAGIVMTSVDANNGYDYGIDMDAATIGTADIRLSNGETISNVTDGVVAISGNLKIVSPATLLVTGSDPGTQVKLLYEASEALGAGKQLQGIQVSATYGNATAAASSGVTAGEFKARAKTDTSGALNQLRGIISTADARNRTVATIYGVEANIASYAGATVTTAVGLQVSQQLNVDGAGGATIYGISIQADDVANTADIQLSGGGGGAIANRPMIMSGAGAPAAGRCTTTNLGSIYFNTSGGNNTSVYICEGDGDWDAIDTVTD